MKRDLMSGRDRFLVATYAKIISIMEMNYCAYITSLPETVKNTHHP